MNRGDWQATVHEVTKSQTCLNNSLLIQPIKGFPGGASGKEPTCQCKKQNEVWLESLGQGDLLDEGMGTHSSILAWRIPWIEEPGWLDPIGL